MAKKIYLVEMTEAEIKALPSATRSRLKVRGWYYQDYHEKQNRSIEVSAEMLAEIFKEAKGVAYSVARRFPVPSWMDLGDMIQEAVMEVWLVSSKPDFHSKKWRQQVMRNRLMKLATKTRGDADNYRKAEINENLKG
ncbi:MAG TPA: hypothetical protein PLP33_24690 [Leptospiraceae bacterium]|nr:hypothetical protein [Leptospiraceae bacterium]